MKTALKIIVLLSSILIFIISCNRNDEIKKESVLTPSSKNKTELDYWIKRNFTDPYNVTLIYKYDDTKTTQEDYVVPASYEKSVQMANIIKYLFFDTYSKHTPKGFLKKYGPKVIMLVGSAAHYPDGRQKLGLAENGVQFSLYNVNNLNIDNLGILSEKKKKERIKELFHQHFRTIYHEFSHILHQTKDYSSDFKKLSAKDYVGDSWTEVWRKPKLQVPENLNKRWSIEAGFLSDYSSKDSNEDFVEVIAHYLINSPEEWEEKLEKGKGLKGDQPGRKILERKIAIVRDYMQSTWNINLDDLRDEIQTRVAKIEELDLNELK